MLGQFEESKKGAMKCGERDAALTLQGSLTLGRHTGRCRGSVAYACSSGGPDVRAVRSSTLKDCIDAVSVRRAAAS
ncbi:hypothetical protein CesoFtcFv8_020350 [Champsocephalus esox]|uniref:Uncharacterized protein n=1 Tax=Champsocephalus esox TaxID=159716 RepID=A0AAN8BGA5_9TELE|nr:hypothetical protein CesoFtcFv8_020350 [Champsocephalus esox]